MIKAVLIPPTGPARWVTMPSSCDAVQEAVGGYFEAVHVSRTHMGFINEDGRMQQLPINIRASELVGNYRDLGPLRGNMLVVGPPDKNGDTTDVDQVYGDTILTVCNADPLANLTIPCKHPIKN